VGSCLHKTFIFFFFSTNIARFNVSKHDGRYEWWLIIYIKYEYSFSVCSDLISYEDAACVEDIASAYEFHGVLFVVAINLQYMVAGNRIEELQIKKHDKKLKKLKSIEEIEVTVKCSSFLF